MPLDFARSAELFCGTEQELALALNMDLGDLRDFRTMNVAADHPVDTATLRLVGERLFEVRDVLHRVLHLVLEIRRNRPVRKAEAAAEEVHEAIELKHERVGAIAQNRGPADAHRRGFGRPVAGGCAGPALGA